jgi:CBS domain-containing protein
MPIVDAMGPRLVSVAPDETVQVAIARILEENVGSVVVSGADGLVGIFTERDVLRLAGEGRDFLGLLVGDVMTRRPVTVPPDTDVLEAAKIMGDRQIRHLPILEGGHVLGVVGIREVLGALVERLWRGHDAEARETARELLDRQPMPTR